MTIYWTTVKEIIEESKTVKTFLLDLNDSMQEFTWTGGAHTHFAMKGFNDGETPDRSMVRHMSIATLPKEKTVAITTRIKENCSPYKAILKTLTVGSEVGLFGTSSNIPLKRTNQKIYLFSSGVGLATFRTLLLEYLENQEGVKEIHSINVDSTENYLYTDLFKTDESKRLTVEFLPSRSAYYERIHSLEKDPDALYYLVGSDDFLRQNSTLLLEQKIEKQQLMIDKYEKQRSEFLSSLSV